MSKRLELTAAEYDYVAAAGYAAAYAAAEKFIMATQPTNYKDCNRVLERYECQPGSIRLVQTYKADQTSAKLTPQQQAAIIKSYQDAAGQAIADVINLRMLRDSIALARLRGSIGDLTEQL